MEQEEPCDLVYVSRWPVWLLLGEQARGGGRERQGNQRRGEWSSSLFVTLWAVAYQAPLSVGFSRQEFQAKEEKWVGMRWDDVCLGMAVKLRGLAHRLDKGLGGEWGVKRDSRALPELGDGAVFCDGQHREVEESILLSRASGVWDVQDTPAVIPRVC